MMQYFKDTDKIDCQLQLVCSRKSTHPSLHSYFIYLDFIEIHRKHKRPKKKKTQMLGINLQATSVRMINIRLARAKA